MVFPDNGVDVHRAGRITRSRYMLCHYEGRREAVEKLLEREYGAETTYGNGLRLEPLHVLGFASAGSKPSNFPLPKPFHWQLSVWPQNYEKREG